ncbi:MAG: type III pantothenate kinase [Luteolibacter sp.]|jgi:type III pantothenate kinase
MHQLLIDNSNSRTKFALGDSGGLIDGWRGILHTADVTVDTLGGLLAGIRFEAVAIASVVPEKAAVITSYFESRGIPVHQITHESPLGIAIDYPHPAQIGADRLANAVGVVARHGAPAIVIDFGTAVTFDAISATPAYCGGVIAPGLGAMSGYLTQRTALLPEVDLAEPVSAIGKSTADAMRVGAVIGYRGLIRGILEAMLQEMDGKPHLIATGGDAGLITSVMKEIDCCDPEITLDGIRRVGVAVFGG